MKESPRQIKLKLSTLAIMINNLSSIRDCQDYNTLGVKKTIRDVMAELDKEVWVNTDVLEESLYYMNLLSQEGRMLHPSGTYFSTFFAREFPRDVKFHRMYNTITYKE